MMACSWVASPRCEASTSPCRERGVSPSWDQNCENNPMQSRDRASHDSKTQDLVAGLPASHLAQPPILSHPASSDTKHGLASSTAARSDYAPVAAFFARLSRANAPPTE